MERGGNVNVRGDGGHSVSLHFDPPVFRVVRPHEVPVGIEENPDAVVAPGDPDGHHGGLDPGAEVELRRGLLILFPHEDPDVVPTHHTVTFFALLIGVKQKFNGLLNIGQFLMPSTYSMGGGGGLFFAPKCDFVMRLLTFWQ